MSEELVCGYRTSLLPIILEEKVSCGGNRSGDSRESPLYVTSFRKYQLRQR